MILYTQNNFPYNTPNYGAAFILHALFMMPLNRGRLAREFTVLCLTLTAQKTGERQKGGKETNVLKVQ